MTGGRRAASGEQGSLFDSATPAEAPAAPPASSSDDAGSAGTGGAPGDRATAAGAPERPTEDQAPTSPSQVREAPQAGGHAMQVDVRGCIRSTQVPLHAAFLPLFEAIVNGIHSTQDRFGADVAKHGLIEVRIRRVGQQSTPGQGRPPELGIESFSIADNGWGFTDANVKSFETAYSTAKAARGGKGLGRFSWLVVCREANIKSVFTAPDGQAVRRSFDFRATPRGVENFVEESPSEADGNDTQRTIVTLAGVRDKYAEALRRSTDYIVERLFEHCFDYLVVGNCPLIRLHDEAPDGTRTEDINEKLAEVTVSEPQEIQVGKHALRIRHVQQEYRSDRHHEARLCANHRVVTAFPLSQVSDLSADPIKGDDGRLVVHHVFVSGDVLDKSVDNTRTRLDLAEDNSLLAWAGSLDMKTLRAAIGAQVNEQLASVLKVQRDENLAKIETHIRRTQPEYGHLLRRRPDQLARLRWSENRSDMDESLYRVQQAWESDVRREQAAVEAKLDAEKSDVDAIGEELSTVIEKVNEVGRSNLVRYVARRRAVLVFLRRLLGKKALEANIHRIVFPTNATSDGVNYDDHNLWLLDDTLAFYDFIASDVRFADNRVAPADSKRRPDLLAFKTGDPPFGHVALVEFKRPDRHDENPVQQLVDYAVLLRDGGAKSADGTSLPGVPKSVRIDAYAVVTLSPEMEKKIRTGPGNMQKIEGDWRWVGGVTGENLTIEVLDFSVFVTRAEQRNRAFFSKLGLV